ncbi:siderophore-interacting protein [Nocardiopsis composta]
MASMSQPYAFSLIEVLRCEPVTPLMARVTFGGEDLRNFTSVAPDQQVKLFFPREGQGAPSVPPMPEDGDVGRWHAAYLAMPDDVRPWMRSYTIRAHRPEANEIDIDFVLHGDGGPASRWAGAARPGDVLGMLGPAAARYREPTSAEDWWLLVGDETALPAIGALVEALPEGTRAQVFAEVRDAAEEQPIARPGVDVAWIHRGSVPPGRGTGLVDAVRGARLPSGAGFAWVAGEASMVRAVRRCLVDEHALPKSAVAFTGYWRLSATQDAPPTEEDLADAAEQLAET